MKNKTLVCKANDHGLQRRGCSLLLFVLLILVSIAPAWAQDDDPLLQLKSMSLENLMQVSVFSASMKQEQLSDVSAAMYVITHEDIIRSGSRTLPDLLRGVPGLQVASTDAHTWSVAARGMGGLFSDKLLVLMDGRSIYTPLYSGVYWDMQGTLIEDIERIEIIRGPGATIWGANAVNGVINIITKKAAETTGGFASVGGGSSDKTNANFRFGDSTEKISYRVYGTHLNRDNYESLDDDGEHADAWKNYRGGFLIDWDAYQDQEITLSGDIYSGEADQVFNFGDGIEHEFENDYSGGNLQLKWEKTLASGSNLQLQTYLDRYSRSDALLDQELTTWDISFNHRFALFSNSDFIWGGGYRYSADDTAAGMTTELDPSSATQQTFNLFAQNDAAFLDDKLHLILGSKFEHNEYTGFEIQPTIRTVWNPNVKNSFWAAVSRAVRTPSRVDDSASGVLFEQDSTGAETVPPGITVPNFIHYQLLVDGNSDFKSEELMAYELGYRTQPHSDVSLDIALYYNDYDNLRTTDYSDISYSVDDSNIFSGFLTTEAEQTASIGNAMKGYAYGAEISAKWQATSYLQLQGTYSWYKLNVDHNYTEDDEYIDIEEYTPEHQASLKSYLDLPYDLQFDTSLYYFSKMYRTDANLRCDLRLGWQPTEALELSFKVESLFDDEYKEYLNNYGVIASAVPRQWFVEMKYRF